jgi:hypothetical protein
VAVSEVKRPLRNRFRSETVKNYGYVTAMAVGKRQRLYSGVRVLTGNYLSSPPQIPRTRGVQL